MKWYRARVAAALFLCFLFCGASLSAEAAEFESLDLAQVKEIVAANKGKVVMINFWAVWCPPCREEIPGLINIRKSFPEDKLVLIGASLDEDMGALRDYVKKTRFNYPIRLASRDLASAAGVSSIPHMLIFDSKGEVIGNAPGYVPEDALRDFLKKQMESQ